MEVYPLSVPQINWEIYIETFQNSFGTSPSSGLDAVGLKLDSPASFIATLDLANQTSPMDVLRNAARNMLLHHSFCSFIYIGDREVITCVPMQVLHVKYKRIKRDEYYAIVSGSVANWREAVIAGIRYLEPDAEFFFKQVYNYMCQAGFKEIWSM